MSVSSPSAVTVFDVFMRTVQAAPGSVFLCAPPAPGRAYHSDRVEFTCSQTRSVFDSYYIVSPVDFQDVARRLAGTFRGHGGIQRLLPVR